MSDNQEEKFLSSVGENIKKYAKQKGMNVSELATAIDMTATGFYRMLEVGSFKVVTLKKISDVLGVSCAELLGEEPNDVEKRVFSLIREVVKEVNK